MNDQELKHSVATPTTAGSGPITVENPEEDNKIFVYGALCGIAFLVISGCLVYSVYKLVLEIKEMKMEMFADTMPADNRCIDVDGKKDIVYLQSSPPRIKMDDHFKIVYR